METDGSAHRPRSSLSGGGGRRRRSSRGGRATQVAGRWLALTIGAHETIVIPGLAGSGGHNAGAYALATILWGAGEVIGERLRGRGGT